MGSSTSTLRFTFTALLALGAVQTAAAATSTVNTDAGNPLIQAAINQGHTLHTEVGCDAPTAGDLAQSECQAMANEAGVAMHAGNWSWAPTGCHTDLYRNDFFFNTASQGSNVNSNYLSICETEVVGYANDAERNAAITQNAGEFGFSLVGEGDLAPGCADDALLYEEECQDLADSLDGVGMATGSWGWAPKGCQWNTKHDGVWFNTHATGSNGNTNYTSVCAEDTANEVDSGAAAAAPDLNQGPTADDYDHASVLEDSANNALNATGSDPEGDALDFLLYAQPTIGTVSSWNGNDGSFRYTPNDNACGWDVVGFRVYDGELYSDVATYMIYVTCQNDAPSISGIPDQSTDWRDGTKSVYLTISDEDTASSSMTVTGVSSAGWLIPDGWVNSVWTESGWRLDINAQAAVGDATITVLVSDGAGGTTYTSFNMNIFGPLPQAPEVPTDNYTPPEDKTWICTTLGLLGLCK